MVKEGFLRFVKGYLVLQKDNITILVLKKKKEKKKPKFYEVVHEEEEERLTRKRPMSIKGVCSTI